MARGLIGAALLSGAGQGLANAAQQGMQFVGLSMLNKQREEMEMRRLALMEQYAGERETRSQEFQRGLQQERLGADITNRSLDRQQQTDMETRKEEFQRGLEQERYGRDQLAKDLDVRRKEEAAERERQKSLDPARIAEESKAEDTRQELGRGRRWASATEAVDLEAAKTRLLAESPGYLDSIRKINAAKETEAQKLDADIKRFQLETSKKAQDLQDAYAEAVQSGNEEKITKARAAWEAHARKPWEEEKVDAQMAALGLKEARTEIDRLSNLIKDAIPGTPEAARLERNLKNAEDAFLAYNTRLQQLTGSKVPTKPSGSVQIKDPFKSPLSGEPEPIQAKGAEKPETPKAEPSPMQDFGGRKEREAAIANRFDSLQSGFDTVASGARGLIDRAKGALMPEPAAPTIQKESKEQALASIGQGNTDQMVVQRREELQQREQALSRPEPKGLIGSAQASIPPAETRNIQQRPQAQARPTPQGDTYEPIIQSSAQKHNVRPDLVRAVIDQESKFNPRAMGKDGDAGLMQLLPGTQKDMGVQDPLDPAQNIEGGTKYLGQLIQRYNGDERIALMAYNWGMGNVDEALKSGKPIPAQVQAYADGILAKSGVGQGGQGDGRSFTDLLQNIPAADQQKVTSDLDAAVQQYRSGQLSEQDFRAAVLQAWLRVPNPGGIETAEQARAIANHYIQQTGR